MLDFQCLPTHTWVWSNQSSGSEKLFRMVMRLHDDAHVRVTIDMLDALGNVMVAILQGYNE